jgi:hypothetical protein
MITPIIVPEPRPDEGLEDELGLGIVGSAPLEDDGVLDIF